MAVSWYFNNSFSDKAIFYVSIFSSYGESYFFSLKMWKITSPPQVTRWNIQNTGLKKHAPSFSKKFTLHENIKIPWLKYRLRTLQENFKREFKPMIENL